jgi:hypothetical protein
MSTEKISKTEVDTPGENLKKQVGKFESNVYHWKRKNEILIYRPQIMFLLDNHNFFATTKDKPLRRSDALMR